MENFCNIKREILIKNLTNEQPKYEYQVVVDRTSVLGNPFRMQSESQREEVCLKYEKWFYSQVENKDTLFMQELSKLVAIYAKYNKLELFCWCYPKKCHAEIIKNYIQDKVNNLLFNL